MVRVIIVHIVVDLEHEVQVHEGKRHSLVQSGAKHCLHTETDFQQVSFSLMKHQVYCGRVCVDHTTE